MAGPPGAVAVIIPAYNSARFLPQALTAVLAQTRPAAEIVVVDDGSADNSATVAAGFPGVQVVRQPNSERAVARNNGLRHTRSPYVAFLDADDWWQPAFLERLGALLDARPDAVAAYSGFQYAAADGTLQPITHHNAVHPPAALDTLLYQNRFQPNCLLIRRAALPPDPFQTDLIPCEDWDVWLTLAQRGPFVGVAEPLALYRQHADNSSADTDRMLRARLAVVARQFGPEDAPDSDDPRAAARHAGYAGAYFWSARALLADGQATAADRLLARVVAHQPGNLTDFHWLYELAAVADGPADALARVDRLLADRPQHARARAVTHLVLAHTAYAAADRAAARRHLLAALRADAAVARHPRWRKLAPRTLVPRALVPAALRP